MQTERRTMRTRAVLPALIGLVLGFAPGVWCSEPAVAGGTGHSLALTDDGVVWAWGYNNYGQLGDNSGADHRLPAAVHYQ